MEAEKQLMHHVRALRKALGLTQKQLAARLGVSHIYISYLENGTRLPSSKLLADLHGLLGQELPVEIRGLLAKLKREAQARSPRGERGNTVYQLQARGLYSLAKLEQRLEQAPGRLSYVLGLFQLLVEQGRLQEADQVILKAIPWQDQPEDRKWLEAHHFQLEGTARGFERAFELMSEALSLFEQRHPAGRLKDKHCELLYRWALIHFDYGIWLFHQSPRLQPELLTATATQFGLALKLHQRLQALGPYPYALLDQANLWFWIALLARYQAQEPEHEREALGSFLACSRQAWLGHHRQGWGQGKPGYYAREYLLISESYQALALARLACLEREPARAFELLERAEAQLARQTPPASKDPETRYRFFYNLAHVYSLQAETLARCGAEPGQTAAALALCQRGLEAAAAADQACLSADLALPLELTYYKQAVGTKAFLPGGECDAT